MKIREIVRSLSGACFVYAIVAACSPGKGDVVGGNIPTNSNNPPQINISKEDSGINTSGTSAVIDSGIVGIVDSAFDSIVKPVKDARADENISGERLRAKYFIGADGSKQFAGWHDSKLNLDCTFQDMFDGTKRCVPFVFGTPGGNRTGYYSDSVCNTNIKDPVTIMTTACAAKPKYFLAAIPDSSDTCSKSSNHMFEAGSEYAYGKKMYIGSSVSCTEIDTSNSYTGYKFYIGNEISLSIFVSANEVVE